jgi:hypothetical protein
MGILEYVFGSKTEPIGNPEVIIPTTHPDDNTQVKMVLRHLETHGRITEAQAMDFYGVKRLSSRISDIKMFLHNEMKGRTVKCVTKQVVKRNGKKVNVTDYYELKSGEMS